MPVRPVFSSRLTTILTLIGVAVGLGNVWRFPYMMGKYGGSAFLLIYLLFTILFAIPALIGEIGLGRATRKGPIDAFKSALGKNAGGVIGWLLLVTILMASSYYSVVIGNVFYTAYYSVFQGFVTGSNPAFTDGLSNGLTQYCLAIFLTGASLFVISRGLHKGIEWVSKLFVPFFLVVILILIYHALTIERSWEYMVDFLAPDFASLTMTQVFAALGQAFYSLSLGGTFMIVYGSYLREDASIPRIASWTAFGDIGAALLTSLFIVPTVLVFELDMTSGPTLIFNTLPHLFSQMPYGQFLGSLFMLALGLVAFLSLVAALEVAYTCLKELIGVVLPDYRLLLLIGFIELILIFPSARDSQVVGLLDLIFGSGMQVLGSGLALIALTWGLGKAATLLQLNGSLNHGTNDRLFYWLKWVIPTMLLLVLIGYIYNTIYS